MRQPCKMADPIHLSNHRPLMIARRCHLLPVILILLCPPPMQSYAQEVVDQPNVLFIAIDDLNDWIGCMQGHPQALTPNIDRLASRGVLFTNAHCAATACNPSRAAVFSGKMPWKTGIWSNTDPKFFQANPKSHVLTDSFCDAGYATFGTGKLMHSGKTDNVRLFENHFDVEQRWSPLTREMVRYTDAELPSKG